MSFVVQPSHKITHVVFVEVRPKLRFLAQFSVRFDPDFLLYVKRIQDYIRDYSSKGGKTMAVFLPASGGTDHIQKWKDALRILHVPTCVISRNKVNAFLRPFSHLGSKNNLLETVKPFYDIDIGRPKKAILEAYSVPIAVCVSDEV